MSYQSDDAQDEMRRLDSLPIYECCAYGCYNGATIEVDAHGSRRFFCEGHSGTSYIYDYFRLHAPYMEEDQILSVQIREIQN